MKYLGLLVAIATVPLLIFGMAMVGARTYSAGSFTLMDGVSLALQILLVVALVLMAMVLWKSHSKPARTERPLDNWADDGTRAAKGVVACLRGRDDGTSDLVFNDVRADHPENPVNWESYRFYTLKNLSDDQLDSLSLTADQYRELGESLVIRLLALNGRID